MNLKFHIFLESISRVKEHLFNPSQNPAYLFFRLLDRLPADKIHQGIKRISWFRRHPLIIFNDDFPLIPRTSLENLDRL